LYYSSSLKKKLSETVADFDVVHLHSVFLWPTWIGARLAYRHRVPYVLTPRGMLVKSLVRRKSRWIKTLWLTLIEKRNLRRANLLHFTSELEKEEYLLYPMPPNHSCVVPNGVDAASPESEGKIVSADIEAATSEPYILFLGRLNWKKGLDRLISAFSAVGGYRLVIAGNDEEGYLEILDKLISQHNLHDRITVIPRLVDGRDKEYLFKNSTLFVLPSYNENFGNTVVEAMSFGIPVLVTSEVGAAEIVKLADAGKVVSAENLNGQLKKLLDPVHSGMLKAMGQQGKKFAQENIAWDAVALRIMAEYQHIIEA
jgi:glycosyltransferase involved in cell wall biosynthesis